MKIFPPYLKPVNVFILFLLLAGIISCQSQTQKADLIITHANIWTGNENQPRAESIAITSDSILFVGSNEEAMEFQGNDTEMIQLNGEFICPGFIDAHIHLMEAGLGLAGVQLRDANSREEFVSRIGEYAKTLEPGVWILFGNWDHTLWGGELPTKDWIDEVTPDSPVFISRLDGHMALANSRALELSGVDRHTADVEGGMIVRDQDGIPTGILKDNAIELVHKHVPPPNPTHSDEALAKAMEYLASNGITSVHDMSAFDPQFGSYDAMQRAIDNQTVITRVYAVNPLPKWLNLVDHISNNGTGNKWLKTGGLKGFVDGSLGAKTAALTEPYQDEKDYRGLLINREEDLFTWISDADEASLQVMVHAIGDRANHLLLDIYEQVASEDGEKDRRFRIEHAQHILPDEIERFGQQGVIASMQPIHIVDDGRWAVERIGPERVKTSYPFRTMLNTGATLAFGSDWPVAAAVPLKGMYAATTRRTSDGKNPGGWIPEEKISAEEALIAFTRNAAYASFDENVKGTLEPGKLADFVVIGEDITKIDPVELWDLKVWQTWVGGRRVYQLNND